MSKEEKAGFGISLGDELGEISIDGMDNGADDGTVLCIDDGLLLGTALGLTKGIVNAIFGAFGES